ncbi:MAG: putative O-succinylbenzoic acid--CoA ligase MenE [Acidimicrobiales bacterium]|nr:MAG: putative O-succinylbenzoic acid--CoA ligase MenE [Acidimicrobiales bacterium]
MLRCWERSDAVFPVDGRIPSSQRRAMFDAVRPTCLIDSGGRVRLAGGRPCEKEDALVLCTSGSAGRPKGVVLTHQAVEAAVRASVRRLACEPAGDKWLACLPLAHMGGLGVVLRCVLTGMPLELCDRPDPGTIETAPRRGVTMTSLVPTLLRRCDVSGYRRVLVGGAAPPPDLPPNVTVTWGMTETCGGVVYDSRPLDGVEVRSVDGELQVRAPQLMRAYRDGTNPFTRDGWLATGDMGVVEADGTVRVLGRKDSMIVTGGENVFPEQVEPILSEHPKVAAVRVSGKPDEEWGQVVCAEVVPADRRNPPTLAELREHARPHLPPWALPKVLEVVERLRWTPSGKPVRGSTGPPREAKP